MTRGKLSERTVRRGSRPAIGRRLLTQLQAVEELLDRHDMADKVLRLPPPDAYTFDKQHPFRDRTGRPHPPTPMMFLGQNEKHQAWALLKHWPGLLNKSSEVVLYNAPGNEEPLEEVKDIQDLALMYPMKVFKIINQKQSMRHLKQFILYVHLYTGNMQRVFAQSLSTVEEVLLAAINVIDKYYMDNGGVENVPDIHRPGEIDNDHLNDEIQTIVGRLNGRVVPTRRRRKGDGPAPSNRAVGAAPNLTRASGRGRPRQKQPPEARPVLPTTSNRKRQLSPVFEDMDADLAEDMDGVSMTGVTEVIIGSKRQAEEYSSTEAIWALKRKKQKIAAEARELRDAMKARAEEKKRLDEAMDEIMDNMSPEELKAFIRKAGADDDDEMALEDDHPAVD